MYKVFVLCCDNGDRPYPIGVFDNDTDREAFMLQHKKAHPKQDFGYYWLTETVNKPKKDWK